MLFWNAVNVLYYFGVTCWFKIGRNPCNAWRSKLHRYYQCAIFFQNTVPFHGTHIHTLNFIYAHKKMQPSLLQFSLNLKKMLSVNVHIYCVDFHQNRTINLANTHRNSLKPLNGDRFRLGWLLRDSMSLNKFLWMFRTKNFQKSDEKRR